MKSMAAAEDASERELNTMAESVIGDDVERIKEKTSVAKDIITPAVRVVLTSWMEDTSGEVAGCDQGDRIEVGVEELAIFDDGVRRAGRGG